MMGQDILRQTLRDESGATAVEYGLIVALIFLAIAGAVAGMANENTKTWNKVSDEMTDANRAAG